MGQFDMVKDFFLGISRSRISLIGGMIVTVTTPFLLAYMLADTVWHIQNPYFGAAVYLALGPVFLGGLAMIFVGAFFFRGERDVHLSPCNTCADISQSRTCSAACAGMSF